jgi:hypothetical protein
MYSLDPSSGTVTRNSDGVVVAPCQSDQDPDFLAYIAWVEAGNQPEQVTPFNLEALIAGYIQAIQDHMDSVAASRNYDGILSLCSYATSENPRFATEGKAGVKWRDAVWDTATAYLNGVQAGEKPIITVEEMVDLLPPMTWV